MSEYQVEEKYRIKKIKINNDLAYYIPQYKSLLGYRSFYITCDLVKYKTREYAVNFIRWDFKEKEEKKVKFKNEFEIIDFKMLKDGNI